MSSSGTATDGATELIAQKLIDPGVDADGDPLPREIAYPIDAQQEGMLLLSDLPEPEKDGLYGRACTTHTGAVFREGDVVELEFTLKEREPQCNAAAGEVYPWHNCDIIPFDVSPTASQDSRKDFKVFWGHPQSS